MNSQSKINTKPHLNLSFQRRIQEERVDESGVDTEGGAAPGEDVGETLEAELRHLPRPGLQGQTGGAGLGGPGENPHTGRVDQGGGAGDPGAVHAVAVLAVPADTGGGGRLGGRTNLRRLIH